MASGYISRNSYDKTSITVSVSVSGLSSGASTPSSSSDTKQEFVSWQITCGVNSATSYSASGNITVSCSQISYYGTVQVSGILNYKEYAAKASSYLWQCDDGTTLVTTTSTQPAPKVVGTGEDQKTYAYVLQDVSYTWDSGTNKSVSTNSFTHYPHPSSFSFNNATSGAKWRVEYGINSLITNIDDFYVCARQKVAWENQSAANACPSLFNSSNRLAANAISQVFSYLGAVSPYRSGDLVSAQIFTDLASLIN